MNKDIVVFSCIFGNYDTLKEPLYVNTGVSFVLFTDNPNIKSNTWKIILVDLKYLGGDPQRVARRIKTNPHLFLQKNHKISVWVDSNYHIRIRDIKNFCNLSLTNNDVAMYKHPRRNCLYKEIDTCINSKLDKPEILLAQKNKYLKVKFPCENGLYHTAVVIRRNNTKVNKINEEWWEEIKRFSRRDQISLPYIFWRNGIVPNIVPSEFGETLYRTDYFFRFKHNRQRTRYE